MKEEKIKEYKYFTIKTNEQIISIFDLEERINQAFENIFISFFNDKPINWKLFEEYTIDFFNLESVMGNEHGYYFNNFTPLWKYYLSYNYFQKAEELWEIVANIAINWEKNKYPQKIHKGTVYYFWGVTSILNKNIDKGYALIHKAFEEDRRESNIEYPDTPARALITLNSEKIDQYFYQWVNEKSKYLKKLLENYRSKYDRKLTYQQFNEKYLKSIPNINATFSLSYLIARLVTIMDIPKYVFDNTFSNQIYLDLLFKITLLTENTIALKNPSEAKKIYYGEHLKYLAQNVEINITKEEYGELKKVESKNYVKVLNDINNSDYTFKNGRILSKTEKDFIISYLIRNYAAHNIDPLYILSTSYKDIEQSIFNIYFLAIECLY